MGLISEIKDALRAEQLKHRYSKQVQDKDIPEDTSYTATLELLSIASKKQELFRLVLSGVLLDNAIEYICSCPEEYELIDCPALGVIVGNILFPDKKQFWEVLLQTARKQGLYSEEYGTVVKQAMLRAVEDIINGTEPTIEKFMAYITGDTELHESLGFGEPTSIYQLNSGVNLGKLHAHAEQILQHPSMVERHQQEYDAISRTLAILVDGALTRNSEQSIKEKTSKFIQAFNEYASNNQPADTLSAKERLAGLLDEAALKISSIPDSEEPPIKISNDEGITLEIPKSDAGFRAIADATSDVIAAIDILSNPQQPKASFGYRVEQSTKQSEVWEATEHKPSSKESDSIGAFLWLDFLSSPLKTPTPNSYAPGLTPRDFKFIHESYLSSMPLELLGEVADTYHYLIKDRLDKYVLVPMEALDSIPIKTSSQYKSHIKLTQNEAAQKLFDNKAVLEIGTTGKPVDIIIQFIDENRMLGNKQGLYISIVENMLVAALNIGYTIDISDVISYVQKEIYRKYIGINTSLVQKITAAYQDILANIAAKRNRERVG